MLNESNTLQMILPPQRKIKITLKLIVLGYFFFLNTVCFAQKKNKGYYFIPKVGIYGSGGLVGTAFSIEGGLLQNNTLIGMSYTRTREFLGANLTNSLDATIGKFQKENSSLFFHGQVGIGIIWGETWNMEKGETYPFSKACLPIKAGFKYIPPHFISLGVDFQVNINSQESIFMIMLTLGVWHLNE